jgi:NADH:ubiquinone oxidoreductase subunit F (NADH-binding)
LELCSFYHQSCGQCTLGEGTGWLERYYTEDETGFGREEDIVTWHPNKLKETRFVL